MQLLVYNKSVENLQGEIAHDAGPNMGRQEWDYDS